jgi:hypothetical protein
MTPFVVSLCDEDGTYGWTSELVDVLYSVPISQVVEPAVDKNGSVSHRERFC